MSGGSTPEHWRQHFELTRTPPNQVTRDLAGVEGQVASRLPYIRRYLPAGSEVLEAGCGPGEYVFLLFGRVRGVPNPFHWLRRPLLRLAAHLDQDGRATALGVHTVVVARRPD